MQQENSTLILEVYLHYQTVPYEQYNFDIKISKNENSNLYNYNLDGYYGDRNMCYDVEYNSFEEAFERLLRTDWLLVNYEITFLQNSYLPYYTKKLIEQLNECKTRSIEDQYINHIKEKLGIQLKMVKNPEKNGLRIINLKGKNLPTRDTFLVGKLDISGNSIIVKNEDDNIELLIPNVGVTVTTEKIDYKRYWYFSKV
jgi:hypothetical protein